jgi:hypothetical protein
MFVEFRRPASCPWTRGRNSVERGSLVDEVEISIEGIACPEIPILQVVEILIETAVPVVALTAEQYALNRNVVVVPQYRLGERLAMDDRSTMLDVL